MPDIKLKICGLRDNAEDVIRQVKPDFAGFIYYEKSPRFVADLDIKSIKGVYKIGVFVNASLEFVKEKIKTDGLDLVQLHGSESPDYCKQINGSIEIIKVLAGNMHRSLQQEVDNYKEVVDYYLFDTKTDKHGGTGIQFDWDKLTGLKINKPIFLSGGIDLASVERLNQLDFDIYAIDVNSRFEDKPGLKNIEKLKTLKEKLR